MQAEPHGLSFGGWLSFLTNRLLRADERAFHSCAFMWRGVAGGTRTAWLMTVWLGHQKSTLYGTYLTQRHRSTDSPSPAPLFSLTNPPDLNCPGRGIAKYYWEPAVIYMVASYHFQIKPSKVYFIWRFLSIHPSNQLTIQETFIKSSVCRRHCAGPWEYSHRILFLELSMVHGTTNKFTEAQHEKAVERQESTRYLYPLPGVHV